jgi:hypothetical protein
MRAEERRRLDLELHGTAETRAGDRPIVHGFTPLGWELWQAPGE